MKHNFVLIPVKNTDREFRLYINGKDTEVDFFYNNYEYESSDEMDEDFYEQIKDISCTDIPENMVLSSGHSIPLKYGDIYNPDVSRIKDKLKIKVYYTTDCKNIFESNINLLKLNLCLINILKEQDVNYSYIHEEDYYVNTQDVGQLTFISFIANTDTNGTIEEKLNNLVSVIKKAEAEAEKMVLNDLIDFVKKLK